MQEYRKSIEDIHRCVCMFARADSRPLLLRMGWLRLVGSLKLYVSFAKEPYKWDDILQKKPMIFKEPTNRSHPIVDLYFCIHMCVCMCVHVNANVNVNASGSQMTVTHCNTLHTATHCNTLQHIATHCSTLQKHCQSATLMPVCQMTVTHCNTM